MAAFEFNALYNSLLIFILAAVPGIALGWPLLHRTKFNFVEKFLLSFFIGLFAVPIALYLEGMLGIAFSLPLVAINFLAITAIGAYWGVKNKAFEAKLPEISIKHGSLEEIGAWVGPMLLLFAVLLAFWLRIQTFSPIYSELDPYFYVYGSGQIIREGAIPLKDDTSWWPEIQSTHRTMPAKMYLEAQWFSTYTGGGAYDNDLLYAIACWLPPISAAFMCFGAYLLISSAFGRRYGLLAAFLLALCPVAIFKLSAGVNEASPPGMMALFMSLGIFAQALVAKHEKRDKKAEGALALVEDHALALLSCFAFFLIVSCSAFASVLVVPFTGLLVLQSIDYFARGRKNNEFAIASVCAFAGLFAGNVVLALYAGYFFDPGWLTSGPVRMAAIGMAFVAISHYAVGLGLPEKKRNIYLAIAVVASLVLLFATPLGAMAKSQVLSYVGSAQFNYPLQRTIAEQNEAGTNFEGEAGFVALVPKNHIDSNAKDIGGAVSNLAYGALGLVASIFSALGNFLLRLMDITFNTLVGTNLATTTKDDSLLFFFLVVMIAGSAIMHFARKGEERDEPSIPLMILLLVLPVLYVGVNKVKFTVFAGVVMAVAAAAAFAMLERFFMWLSERMKVKDGGRVVKGIFIALVVLLVIAEATIPSKYPLMILSKSFEPRYQDAPDALMPRLAAACEALRGKGYYDEDICAAGYEENYSNSINNQFNSKVCLVSQLTSEELLPGSGTEEQIRSGEAKAGANFRCNRIGDYWIETMEWINGNLSENDRVTSWWDYGHWTNYLGERKTVLRNEHASTGMIGRVAHDYIIGSTQDLIDSMNYFDSRYVLFDSELIGGINGQAFGGKYGALNYLGCAHEGETDVNRAPGTSDCEFRHSPERVAIMKVQTAQTACVVSESQQRTGTYAYVMGKGGFDFGKPTYCAGDVTLANGQTVTGLYRLDKKDANGDLALRKGLVRVIEDGQDAALAEMVYVSMPLWQNGDGTTVGGLEDAPTEFYTSNLYRGVVLGELPGFDLVFKSKNGEVKIYRMRNFVGNKDGYIDKEAASKNY